MWDFRLATSVELSRVWQAGLEEQTVRWRQNSPCTREIHQKQSSLKKNSPKTVVAPEPEKSPNHNFERERLCFRH